MFVTNSSFEMYLLHRYINVQAKNLLAVLIVHPALNGVGSHWGLDIEDSFLNNADLSRFLRARKTVDIDVSTIQRKVDSRILAKTSTLSDHLDTQVRGRKFPNGTLSDSLVNLSISVHSCIFFRDNWVVDDLHRVEKSMSIWPRANLPGDRSRRSENNLKKSEGPKPTATTKRAKINFMK